jgi:hypothetical protein
MRTPLSVLWLARRMCALGDDELALRIAGVEIDGRELAGLTERRAGYLVASERLFLIDERRAIPDFDEPPNTACDHIRAAAHPGGLIAGADPDLLVHQIVIFGLDVVGAIFKTHQVTRCLLLAAGAGSAAEAELRPTDDRDSPRDAGQVMNGVKGHLRVVGTGLHDQVAAGAFGFELVTGEDRQID